ncbi:hypothetical protein STEG23_011165 [Scotinomys teguina]
MEQQLEPSNRNPMKEPRTVNCLLTSDTMIPNRRPTVCPTTRKAQKSSCYILCPNIQADSHTYSAQMPTGPGSQRLWTSGHTLSAQRTRDNSSPCGPNHTLSHTHGSAPKERRADFGATRKLLPHSETIACFFGPIHTVAMSLH